MKFQPVIAIFAALVAPSFAMDQPSFHTKGAPVGKPTGPLKPGQYWWKPGLSPPGPVVALVSLPQQTMHVYRNGILIGRSSISSGSKGNSTPPGVFEILEKKETHYSKKYDNAPMPNMQRLTWTGIAMHSGQLPGYPASHGCIRLPYDFSALLFDATSKGGTVAIGDGKTPQPHLASNPGLMLAPSRWMRVDGEGSGVIAEKFASRLRFSPEFAHKVADTIAPGTTVIVTDAPAVRKPVVDSTYFAAN